MSTTLRRDFLQRAGALVAGAALAHAAPSLDAGSYDVKTFDATGDGKTLDTAAINKAIDAAAAVGGGTVLFPAGNYLSYSIHLKSNVALHLNEGATIIAADPLSEAGAPVTTPLSPTSGTCTRTSATATSATA